LRKMCALENARSSDQQEESAFSNADVCVKRELRKGVMWRRIQMLFGLELRL
jgi:hypothetical protein